jgi:hypothetical protein
VQWGAAAPVIVCSAERFLKQLHINVLFLTAFRFAPIYHSGPRRKLILRLVQGEGMAIRGGHSVALDCQGAGLACPCARRKRMRLRIRGATWPPL